MLWYFAIFLRYCGISRIFLQYCGVQNPPMSPSSMFHLHYFNSFRFLAEMAAFIACAMLICLGYFIGLRKCVLQPSTTVTFLGYICHSLKQAFILPQDKRIKFASLQESILEHKTVSLKNLQKFAGKTTSFALLVPAAKLFSNAVYRAISHCNKASSSQDLRKELIHWKFLDSWEGFLPWRDECHLHLSIFSDASFSG